MTLREAARILTEHRHAGKLLWQADHDGRGGLVVTIPGPCWKEFCFSPFEAIAIAEKYQRGDTPAEADQAAAREPAGDL